MRSLRGAPITGREVTGTRAIATALGVCVGVSGLDHGFFEVLQGNVATPGFIIQAIGPAQRMWVYGTEEAFTLVPNFLLTGMLAMVVGLLTIAWSIGSIDQPNGPRVLLLLGGLLFLVGGGIAMVVVLLFAWAVARRIGRPLMSAPSRLPRAAGTVLRKAWRGLLVAGLALYAVALEIAIVGFIPGVSDPDQALATCWFALLAMLATIGLAFVGASAGTVTGTRIGRASAPMASGR